MNNATQKLGFPLFLSFLKLLIFRVRKRWFMNNQHQYGRSAVFLQKKSAKEILFWRKNGAGNGIQDVFTQILYFQPFFKF